MPSEQEFRQQIDRYPNDDALRMAFADWLEERGDARAADVRRRVTQIARIKDKLERLAAIDVHRKVFAAGSHRYKLVPALQPAQVRAIEAKYQIHCSDDYFDFLVRIAEGGAGPAYGIYLITKTCHSIREGDFPIDEAIPEILEYEGWGPGHEIPGSAPGCLWICEYGCGTESALIVRGKGIGQVWTCAGAEDGLWHSERMTFLPWYEAWLDESLDDLAGSDPAQ